MILLHGPISFYTIPRHLGRFMSIRVSSPPLSLGEGWGEGSLKCKRT